MPAGWVKRQTGERGVEARGGRRGRVPNHLRGRPITNGPPLLPKIYLLWGAGDVRSGDVRTRAPLRSHFRLRPNWFLTVSSSACWRLKASSPGASSLRAHTRGSDTVRGASHITGGLEKAECAREVRELTQAAAPC